MPLDIRALTELTALYKDGVLTKEQFEQAKGELIGQPVSTVEIDFKMADTDGDGVVSPEELAAYVAKIKKGSDTTAPAEPPVVALGKSVATAPLAPVAEPVAILAPMPMTMAQPINDINNNTTAGGLTNVTNPIHQVSTHPCPICGGVGHHTQWEEDWASWEGNRLGQLGDIICMLGTCCCCLMVCQATCRQTTCSRCGGSGLFEPVRG